MNPLPWRYSVHVTDLLITHKAGTLFVPCTTCSELIIEGGNPAASAIVIEANPAHCVQDLKAQIESEVGIPMPQQQLVLRDQILADDAGVLGELVTQAESVQVQVATDLLSGLSYVAMPIFVSGCVR